MNETPPIRQRFNKVADMTMHEAVTNKRVEGAIERMNDRFAKCEPALAQSRYRDLLTRQGSSPELRPSYAQGDSSNRMWKAAKQMVRYEHLHRLNKIRNVGERIIGRRRDEMGR